MEKYLHKFGPWIDKRTPLAIAKKTLINNTLKQGWFFEFTAIWRRERYVASQFSSPPRLSSAAARTAKNALFIHSVTLPAGLDRIWMDDGLPAIQDNHSMLLLPLGARDLLVLLLCDSGAATHARELRVAKEQHTPVFFGD